MQDYQFFNNLYSELKFWGPAVTALWGAFKVFSWLKAIKTNDLHHIQLGLNETRSELKDQTSAIVGELKELRQDLRTFYRRD